MTIIIIVVVIVIAFYRTLNALLNIQNIHSKIHLNSNDKKNKLTKEREKKNDDDNNNNNKLNLFQF